MEFEAPVREKVACATCMDRLSPYNLGTVLAVGLSGRLIVNAEFENYLYIS